MSAPVRRFHRPRVAAAIAALVTSSLVYTSTPEAPKQVGYPFTSAARVNVQMRFFANGGTGTLIAKNETQAIVLTVKHVAERVGLPAKCTWGNETCNGRVLAVHPHADLALLIVNAPKTVEPVPVALPADGNDPFYLCGYPGYDRQTLRWQAGNFLELDGETLTVDCMPEEGMSGGPAFDQNGRVIGAVSAYSPTTREGFCGSGRALVELLYPYMEK